MTRIHKIKNISQEILTWFERYEGLHPGTAIDMVYTYAGMRGKTYGVIILKDGRMYDNSHQMSLKNFETIDCYITPARIV